VVSVARHESRTLVSDGETIRNNAVPQIWDGEDWRSLPERTVSLFPRLVVLPDGKVFVAGTDVDGAMLTTAGAGGWTAAPNRAGGDRQYAPALQFAPGNILFMGGGNDVGSNQPTANAEKIDFTHGHAEWTQAAPMNFRRRQHNATLLPDGTVLVTGGTRGGGFDGGFNDLSPGAPVLEPELWAPATGHWTALAAETNERCYHSIALLLPDATVLSAGGGEYKPNNQDIPPEHVHRDGQIFHPPYLFRGERPSISAGPDAAGYNSTFELTVSGAAVARLTALRLGSVTHSLDTNQRLVEIAFAADGERLTVTAPPDRNGCPPGWYMLFALSAAGVPSHAHMIRFGEPAIAPLTTAARSFAGPRAAAPPSHRGTRVVIGLTSRCPYGLAACWGGAYQSLLKLSGVAYVNPVADARTSTAEVFLHGDAIPDPEQWKLEFQNSANASYDIRGLEVSVKGRLSREGDRTFLVLSDGQQVDIGRPAADSKIQWNWDARAPEVLTEQEQTASERLAPHAAASRRAKVTGPLRRQDGRLAIAVRSFEVAGQPE
jgi:galactose oxidase